MRHAFGRNLLDMQKPGPAGLSEFGIVSEKATALSDHKIMRLNACDPWHDDWSTPYGHQRLPNVNENHDGGRERVY